LAGVAHYLELLENPTKDAMRVVKIFNKAKVRHILNISTRIDHSLNEKQFALVINPDDRKNHNCRREFAQ
jgi:hypothetical protein